MITNQERNAIIAAGALRMPFASLHAQAHVTCTQRICCVSNIGWLGWQQVQRHGHDSLETYTPQTAKISATHTSKLQSIQDSSRLRSTTKQSETLHFCVRMKRIN